jgi:hypothetical protein
VFHILCSIEAVDPAHVRFVETDVQCDFVIFDNDPQFVWFIISVYRPSLTMIDDVELTDPNVPWLDWDTSNDQAPVREAEAIRGHKFERGVI